MSEQMVLPENDKKKKKFKALINDIANCDYPEDELSRANDILIHMEKLASIGRLSAGVIHEILSPVNIIYMKLQLLQAMENSTPEIMEEVKLCMDQVKRIVNITTSLKQCSRTSKNIFAMNDINRIISSVLNLYLPQLKIEKIKVDINYQSDLPPVRIDSEKIEQVILNLISNAVAAMENKDEKVLRVSTRKETREDSDYLKIIFADTGSGIKEENVLRLFNPFFTTKESGRGIGLGLYLSFGIIQDHGGKIWAENNEWGGAAFFIELPV